MTGILNFASLMVFQYETSHQDDTVFWLEFLAGVVTLFLVIEIFYIGYTTGQLRRELRVLVGQMDLLLRYSGLPAKDRQAAIETPFLAEPPPRSALPDTIQVSPTLAPK